MDDIGDQLNYLQSDIEIQNTKKGNGENDKDNQIQKHKLFKNR